MKSGYAADFLRDVKMAVNPEKDRIQLAMVIEVKEGVGVKIQIEGESAPRETYYNSLAVVEKGDRVFF